jgi:DnaJ-class molecular chaperone
MKNPYQVLGVDRSAPDEEVKDAYREKAKEHHPDRGGDAEKFKEIQEAKQQILEGGTGGPGQSPFGGGGFNPGDVGGFGGPGGFGGEDKSVEDFIRDFADFTAKGGFESRGFQGNPFEGQAGPDPRSAQSSSPKLQVYVDFETAVLGGQIEIRGRDFNSRKIDVPPGVKNGTVLDYGGNLVVEFNVEEHPDFWRANENDIHTEKEISVYDAMTGKDGIEVDTLQGKTVRLSVPPGTHHGEQFRLEGWGGPKTFNNVPQGDMYVEVELDVPAVTDEEKQELIESELRN